MATAAAATVAALNAATDASTLEAALESAKAQGFSNRHDAFKDAKRRLFALKSGVTEEALPAKSQRKRPPVELPTGPPVAATAADVAAAEAEARRRKAEKRARHRKAAEAADGADATAGTPESKKHRIDAGMGEATAAADDADAEAAAGEEAAVVRLEHQVRIQGFSPALQEDRLEEFVGECGKIRDVTLVRNKQGRSRRIAFVAFKRESGAEAALELHDSDCFGFKVKVTKAAVAEEPKAHKGKDKIKELASLKGKSRIFVGGLPYTTDEKKVRKLLERQGELEALFFPVNKRDGKCRGFALATFATREGTEKALALNGTTFRGSKLITEIKAKGGKYGEEGRDTHEFTVFVGGLFSIAKKKIRRHFAECGEIAAFDMPLTADGESKGIAFVSFKHEEGLRKALELHDTELGKRRLTVERRRAKDGDSREKAKKGSADSPAKGEMVGTSEAARRVRLPRHSSTWGNAAKVQFQDSDEDA